MAIELYRGTNYGVFAGPNGYYVAEMAKDGVSHYQPAGAGNGWDVDFLDRLNEEAIALDSNFDP